MGFLALALFIALFATADQVVHGSLISGLSSHSSMQLALFASFLFGIITSYRKST